MITSLERFDTDKAARVAGAISRNADRLYGRPESLHCLGDRLGITAVLVDGVAASSVDVFMPTNDVADVEVGPAFQTVDLFEPGAQPADFKFASIGPVATQTLPQAIVADDVGDLLLGVAYVTTDPPSKYPLIQTP